MLKIFEIIMSNALITLSVNQFVEFAPEQKIREVHIYGRYKVVILLSNGQKLFTCFTNFPNYKAVVLVQYLSQSHFTATRLSDGSYKIDAYLKVVGGAKMRKIHLAAQNGDVALLKDSLNRKVPGRYSVDVVCTDKNQVQRTALQIACESDGSAKFVEMVDLLLAAGAKVNLSGDPDQAPLALALKKNNWEIAKKLIKAGADVNNCRIEVEFGRVYTGRRAARDLLHRSPLQYVCESKDNGELLDLLIQAKADLNFPAQDTVQAPLAIAMENDHFDSALKLVQAGANVNIRVRIHKHSGSEDVTPLQMACKKKHVALVEAMVAKGANVNDVGSAYWKYKFLWPTPLDLVTQKNEEHYPIAKILIKAKATCNVFYTNLNELCESAVDRYRPKPELLKILLECKVQYPFLHKAIEGSSNKAVEELLSHGCDVDSLNDKGETPLATALRQYDSYRTVDLLLDKGADSTKISPFTFAQLNGEAKNYILNHQKSKLLKAFMEARVKDLLHIVAENGNDSAVRYLLANGYDIDSYDEKGNTPLAIALKNKKLSTATLLLDSGADTTKIPPSIYAALKADTQYFLQTHKQKSMMPQRIIPQPAPQAASSSDLLNTACQSGDLNAVQAALNSGLTPDAKTLTFACISGKMEIVDLVLAKGAQPDSETLTAACATNNLAIVEKMIRCKAIPTKTTLEIARETKNFQIVDLIVRAMSQSL